MLPGDVPLEMVYIGPGTFMMGRYPGEQDSHCHQRDSPDGDLPISAEHL